MEADFMDNLSRQSLKNFTDTEDDDDDSPMIALSIIWQSNRLGAAYYVFDTEHMYLMPDHSDTPPLYAVLNILLKQVQPTFIVTTCKADEKIIDILNSACLKKSSETSSADLSSEDQNVILLPNIDFAYESCRHHLQNLDIPGIPENMNDAERRLFFSSLIDFKSACMVKAAGGLLKFVRQKSLTESLSVLAISNFHLKNVVHVSENTFRDLQIFQDERHPSVYKSAVGIKEGLSLYGICNKCKSSIGKKELKRWFYLPSNNLLLIEERQAAIHFFSLAKNLEIVQAIQSSLKQIKNLYRIFTHMKTAQATINDWKTLYKASYHAMVIGEICRSHSSSLKIFNEIDAAFSEDLFRVASLLDKVIDFEEYTRQNHFAVKPGVDSEIDKMKHIYNGLPDFMTEVAHQELQDLPSDIEHCSVIYLPQLGYLLTVPLTENMKVSKDYNLPNLKFMFVLNDSVHYKSERTRNLDSLLGDTLCDIYDKETQIMHRLQNMILGVKGTILSFMDLLAKLDCLISLSVASKEYNWVQPQILSNGSFSVQKARHPLLELCVPCFVPNDIYSGDIYSRIKILTGPNSSGKSIYLKQVALISFLAHIGCFVPAQKAQIPLLDSIFSCIENVESISINLSSFFISLNELSMCLKFSSANSLVLVDEFGKHTEGRSGLALLVATIKFWLSMGPSSPHVFLATHYLSLNHHFSESPFLSFQTIDVAMNENLVIFHQLVDGIAASSYAANTAAEAGLPESVVKRCLEIENYVKSNLPIPACDSSFQDHKLEKYLSIYDAFVKLNPSSEEEVGYFLNFVKHRSKD